MTVDELVNSVPNVDLNIAKCDELSDRYNLKDEQRGQFAAMLGAFALVREHSVPTDLQDYFLPVGFYPLTGKVRK